MVVLTARLTIGTQVLSFAHQVEIASAWEQLTDTCSITLPRTAVLDGQPITSYFRPGNRVVVELGYDGVYVQEFSGYVARIQPGPPAVLECEDEMYWLKRATVSKTWAQSITLHTLIDYLASQVPAQATWRGALQAGSVQLGPVRLDRISIAKALEGLQKNFGLFAFFRTVNGAPVLVVGQPYSKADQRTIVLDTQRNVPQQDLTFARKEDTPLKVEATNHLPNGSRVTVALGYPEGDTRTLNYYNCPDFRTLAEADLRRMQYDGYTGAIETFGQPVAQHGDIVRILDAAYPERDGNYYIDATSVRWGVDGYRRTLTLGPRA
jgi:hypothetical protein